MMVHLVELGPSPRVEVLADAEAVGRRVADLIAESVRARCEAVLGLATGSTPGPSFAELVRRSRAGELDLGGVSVFLLDEYVGLSHDHPCSYHATIRRELTDAIGVPDERVHGPDVLGELDASCAAFEAAIVAAGGIDLQLLGIGRNGHIAFNEPGTPFDSLTHVSTLTETTRRDNARFFDSIDDVPTHALTQGLATIARARRLVLVATGSSKADAMAAALEGPVSAVCPASIIQVHGDALVILDRAAAAQLGGPDQFSRPARSAN
jgi:glucosamine-6-phosphate deaminase